MERSVILNRVKIGIQSKDPGAEIFLFGSRARGEAKPGSDWDFLVLSPSDRITFEKESIIRDPIIDLELESGEVISLLVYSKKDWLNDEIVSPLFDNVRNEGVRI